MRILITGAASGIGQGLARRLAAPGETLILGDIDAEGLERTALVCAQQGSAVETRAIDVRDRAAVREWVTRAAGPRHDGPRLDLVFICAGRAGGLPPAEAGEVAERESHVRTLLDVNLTGALNTLLPAMEALSRQPAGADGIRGRICAVASVAGFVSYPGTPSYCASKAALDRFVVANAPLLERRGVTLTSICCAFVDTPMVAGNRFPMPGLVTTGEAVSRILKGTLKGKRRVIFPRWLVLGSRAMDLLPPRLAELYYCRQPSARPGALPEY